MFEEIIKNTRVKSWLAWNDSEMKPDNTENQEHIFSWISKEKVVEESDEGTRQEVTDNG